jgi:hypothetical protein
VKAFLCYFVRLDEETRHLLMRLNVAISAFGKSGGLSEVQVEFRCG